MIDKLAMRRGVGGLIIIYDGDVFVRYDEDPDTLVKMGPPMVASYDGPYGRMPAVLKEGNHGGQSTEGMAQGQTHD